MWLYWLLCKRASNPTCSSTTGFKMRYIPVHTASDCFQTFTISLGYLYKMGFLLRKVISLSLKCREISDFSKMGRVFGNNMAQARPCPHQAKSHCLKIHKIYDRKINVVRLLLGGAFIICFYMLIANICLRNLCGGVCVCIRNSALLDFSKLMH